MKVPFFAIRCGSRRVAVLVGPLAIKFPREWRWLWRRADRDEHADLFWRWSKACVANVTEATSSHQFCHPFLAKVYLTLAAVSVQRRVEGRALDDGEIRRRIIDPLPPEAREMAVRQVDAHCTTGGNWIETPDGKIYLIDYGDTWARGVPMSEFLATYGHLINGLCGHSATG